LQICLTVVCQARQLLEEQLQEDWGLPPDFSYQATPLEKCGMDPDDLEMAPFREKQAEFEKRVKVLLAAQLTGEREQCEELQQRIEPLVSALNTLHNVDVMAVSNELVGLNACVVSWGAMFEEERAVCEASHSDLSGIHYHIFSLVLILSRPKVNEAAKQVAVARVVQMFDRLCDLQHQANTIFGEQTALIEEMKEKRSNAEFVMKDLSLQTNLEMLISAASTDIADLRRQVDALIVCPVSSPRTVQSQWNTSYREMQAAIDKFEKNYDEERLNIERNMQSALSQTENLGLELKSQRLERLKVLSAATYDVILSVAALQQDYKQALALLPSNAVIDDEFMMWFSDRCSQISTVQVPLVQSAISRAQSIIVEQLCGITRARDELVFVMPRIRDLHGKLLCYNDVRRSYYDVATTVLDNLANDRNVYFGVDSAAQAAHSSQETTDFLSAALWEACNASDRKPSLEELQRLLANPATRSLRVNYKDERHGKFPLHILAAKGLASAVKLVLDAKADVNARKKYLHTPLHLAVSNGSLETVQVLLDAGANPSAADKDKFTPLHKAAAKGYVDIVRALLFAGSSFEAKTASGETAADLSSSEDIKKMCSSKAVFEVRLSTDSYDALQRGHAHATGATDLNDHTPLHLWSNIDVGPWLATGKSSISALSSNVEIPPASGETTADLFRNAEITRLFSPAALFQVCSDNMAPSQELLQELLAYPSTRLARATYSDDRESTALHEACQRGYAHAIEALLNARADLEAENSQLQRPLHLACAEGHLSSIKALLDARAGVEVRDSEQKSPLHLASARGHNRAIGLLLDARANIGANDLNDRTPLHFAAFSGHVRVVEDLLRRGASANAIDKNFETPLHSAAQKGNADLCAAEIIQKLIAHSADVDAKDRNQCSTLHFASQIGHTLSVEVLVKSGADLEAENDFAQRPVHLSATSGRSAILQILLGAGAAVDAQDHRSQTALHLAAMNGHADCVQLLISRGADIESKNHNLFTPLHLASACGYPLTVQKLLEAGADINAQDSNGRTPQETGNSLIVYRSFVPTPSVIKLRNMRTSGSLTLELSSMPSLCSIVSAIRRVVSARESDFLSNKIGLNSLSISHCALHFSGVSLIAKELHSLSSLTSVDICGNPELGQTGVLHLMKCLPTSVISLKLGNTGLRDISQDFCSCLCTFSSLTSLDISDNKKLTNNHLKLFLQALPTSLKVLNLHKMGLHIERVVFLQASLARLNQIEDLNLSHNYASLGEMDSATKFDSIFEICHRCFPRLHSLNLSDVPMLHNVPPKVSHLSNLRTLKMNNCVDLTSLPDEIEDMLHERQLHIIELNGSKNIEFPPYSIATQGFQKIREYLAEAKSAKPLKKCKVVFLGNGGSGKTSLLRSLAEQPMSPNEAFTRGVSTSHDFSDKIKPSLWQKFTGKIPELVFWDFAGALEYSAAHDFFMSNAQAVYVIIFNSFDDRESQVHQVTFWLRTVLTHNVSRDFSRVRVVIVGTKIDLIEPNLLDKKLDEIKQLMVRAVNSVFQKVTSSHASSADIVSVKFATAHGPKNSDFKKMREDLKDHIFKQSSDIFSSCGRLLRFPPLYSHMSSEILKLQKKMKKDHQIPIFKLSDQSIVTPKYKTLYGSHNNSIKFQALRILSDVGELMCYEVEGSTWICVQPQLFANAIALFADPATSINSTSSREDIFKKFEQNQDKLEGVYDDTAREKLLEFLVALKVLIPQSEVGTASSHRVEGSTISSDNMQYLVPLALRGRPGYWSEIVDVSSIRAIRGLRYTARHMVSVATFLRLMCKICSLPKWGCAFVTQVNGRVCIFVRLAESRCSVDLIVLGTSGELSSTEIEKRCQNIASELGCDSHSYSFLCPQCCQSDAFLRIGNAHSFFLQEKESSLNRLLSCSHYHTPNVDGVKFGIDVSMSGTAKNVLTDNSVLDRLDWADVATGVGIRRGKLTFVEQRTTCDGHVAYVEIGTNFDTIDTVGPDSYERQDLLFRGTLLPNSFFVLTKQALVDDIFEEKSFDSLFLMAMNNIFAEEFPARFLRRNGPIIAIFERTLRFKFSLGDRIYDTSNFNGEPVTKEIVSILSLARGSEVCDSEYTGDGIWLLRTTGNHDVESGTKVMLCFPHSQGGGVECFVEATVSANEVLVYAENHDSAFSTCQGITLLPCLRSFGPNDHVLVICKTGKKTSLDVFSGKGKDDQLKMCQMTTADCRRNSAVAECWRDVENHWEVMLGTESKNYEISRITMFRNLSRERMFSNEIQSLKIASRAAVFSAPRSDVSRKIAEQTLTVAWDHASVYNPTSSSLLAASATHTPSDPFSVSADKTMEQKVKRQQLQDQVMNHFNEFSDKFGLQSKKENKDVNLSVAWWGESPASYITTAQHGFENFPAQFKLDPGNIRALVWLLYF
jgi:ankyrin repeat protein/GTPase SAR1 family protein